MKKELDMLSTGSVQFLNIKHRGRFTIFLHIEFDKHRKKYFGFEFIIGVWGIVVCEMNKKQRNLKDNR